MFDIHSDCHWINNYTYYYNHAYLYCPFYASPTILVRTDLTITKQSMTSKAITASNNDGNILILGGIDGRVRAIRINDDNGIKKEKEIWTFTSLNRKPIFTKCVLFMDNHHNQYVVFGSHDGSITCLSAIDGKERWTFQTKSAIMSTPLIQKNDDISSTLIVVLTLAGSIIVLHSHDGKEYK